MIKSQGKGRILLRASDANVIKRLVNIHSMYENGKLFEYKITLDGFCRGNYSFIKKVRLHSVDGFIRAGKKRKLRGTHIEISYHSDGKTAYKDIGGEWNIKPMLPNIPICKIREPKLCFRVVDFCLNNLLDFNKPAGSDDDLLSVLPYTSNTRLTCDFHISGRPPVEGSRYRIFLEKGNPFKNSFFVYFDDPVERKCFQLHFYETNVTGGPYFAIMRNDWWGITEQKLYSLFYVCKKFFSKYSKR